MQINYFLSANSHPLFYQFHVANRHLQTARAIYKQWSLSDHSQTKDLVQSHILSPTSINKEISLRNWAFHLILGLTELGLADFFIFPGVGLTISLADRYFFNRDRFPFYLDKEWIENVPSPLPPIPLSLKKVIDQTPAFNFYKFARDSKTILTGIPIRPANLFFQALGPLCATTMPGELMSDKQKMKIFREKTDKPYTCFFEFHQPHDKVQKFIRSKPDAEVVSFSAQGTVVERYLGTNTYHLSFEEIKAMLDSHRVYVSPLIPKSFYLALKKAMAADKMVILPGHDSAPMLISTLMNSTDYPHIRDLLQQVESAPQKFGFVANGTMLSFDQLKSLTAYQVGSMVIQTEEYHCFVTDGYELAQREIGEQDQIHLINMCGIRGFHRTPNSEMNKLIMKETFKLAMRSVGADGYFITPAIGMGVWRGDPEVYWTAFFDAIVELDIPLERILVSPGHQTTKYGKYIGKNGSEFETFLKKYQKDFPENQNLANTLNLFSRQTDVLILAKRLKKEFPDKVIGLINAGDPDGTLGYHKCEYVNNQPHTHTTDENFGAAGSSGLMFETLTGVLEDPLKIIG